MWKWIQALDGVLRGDATRPAVLRDGQIPVPLGGLGVLCIILGALYGFCMGWFALFNRASPEYMQVVASMIKVPALFLLTLLVTLPSLYVFNALAGSRLGGGNLFKLLVASIALTLAVLASFGPIVAFFSVTTTSYPFMLLLNVVVFTISGAIGLRFLLQTMYRLTPASGPPPVPATPAEDPVGALDRSEHLSDGRRARAVFICWIFVYGLVGAQMSWVLRPFVGTPDRPFSWFRHRESNFFEAIKRTIQSLFQ